jgi:hypothetical protein
MDQTAVITTKGSDIDTLLAVYTGESVSQLTLVASNDDIFSSTYVLVQSQVSFDAVAGTHYWIAVDGCCGAIGTVVLNLNPPANDDFADACVITGASGTVNGSTLGASKEPYEPAHAYEIGGHSAWYRWMAPQSGPVEFSTSGSGFNTILAVYANDNLADLALVTANHDAPGKEAKSTVSFCAEAGTTYQVAIDGAAGETGSFSLNWNMSCRLDIVPLAEGQLQLILTGINWQRYTLLDSADLLTWATNGPTITLSDGSHRYTNSVGPDRRYYRVVLSQ